MDCSNRRKFRRFIALSFFFHFLILIVGGWWSKRAPQALVEPKLTWIELEPLPPKDAPKMAEDKVKKQLVQTEVGQLTKEAPKDAFLSEKNQRVQKETVNQTPHLVETPKKQAQKAVPKPAEPAAMAKSAPAEMPLAKFGVPLFKDAPLKQNERGERIEDRTEQIAEQGSRPEDYVKGVEQADRTLLNTKEFIFYGYFNRIRTRLDQAWVPILKERVYRLFRMGRSLASDQEHTTRILVVLNSKGEVVRVKILSESGTQDLDDAAVQAFNAAGPFPNPPRGIIDANREIQIPWEFILKT